MNDIIYHYTDGDGLLGIFASRALWCTHISYLNDAFEHKHARSVYRQMLTAICSDASRPELTKRFAATAILRLEQNSIDALRGDSRRCYAASFSEKGDDLAQWRGYSGAGPRFAIGFRKSELTKLHTLCGMKVAAISYDEDAAAKEMQKKFLEGAEVLARDWLTATRGYSDPISIHPPELFKLNTEILEPFIPLLKHPKFEAEAEWRLYSDVVELMKMAALTSKFRVGKSFLVPYIEVDLGKLDYPIASITVGPTPHPEEAKMSILRVIASQPIDPPRLIQVGHGVVGVSAVPYRDW
jgi:DUF2971 family protein